MAEKEEPREEVVNETITLKVRDQAGEEMFFKVKKSTRLQKMMDAYAARKGIATESLRFQLDGNRISGDDTPKMLELEENDQIDVSMAQIGGSW